MRNARTVGQWPRCVPFFSQKEWEILNRLVLERQLLPSLRIATLVSCEARKNHFFK